MESILSFDDQKFDNLFLANPTRLQGGAYFSKLFLDENTPVVFQTPKSSTKNGLVMTAKKTYCDLLFNTDDQKFVQWIENFEQAIQFLIYQKRDLWFHNDMELEDIEYFFNPSIRLFNKNKYLLRCYMRQPKHIKKPFDLQIYDENENILTVDDVNKNQKIISILEVLGIKFTSQSFNIDYCLRQIMIIDDKPLFNRCLINPKHNMKKPDDDQTKNVKVSLIIRDISNNIQEEDAPKEDAPKEDAPKEDAPKEDAPKEDAPKEPSEDIPDAQEESEKTSEKPNKSEENFEENIKEEVASVLKDIQISLEDSNPPVLTKFKEEINKEKHLENSLREIDVLKMKSDETITLKKPNEVYLKIYKEARKKAKKARQEAIKSFLEAKRIKNTFLVGDVESDDSDSDVEEIFGDLV